jgi:fatty acid desaturase
MRQAFLNGGILLAALASSWGLLWGASHLGLVYAVLCAWLFSLINNTLFSLMHEAVHGLAATSFGINRLIGTIASWTFPTSLSLQHAAHMGHHRRNRTDEELYDYYLPGQSRLKRSLWLYAGNLFGMYWLSVVLSNLLLLVAPWAYRSSIFVERFGPALGFGAYLQDLKKVTTLRLWLEVALAFAYQAAVFLLLDLHWLPTLLCYVCFALHWSVLQYADHAWSAREVRSGAWNLRVLAPSRWLALNYHYHQAHHQYPEIPWYRLPEYVDPASPQPAFWQIYFSLWKGVRPAPPMGAPADLAFLFPEQQPTQRQTEH